MRTNYHSAYTPLCQENTAEVKSKVSAGGARYVSPDKDGMPDRGSCRIRISLSKGAYTINHWMLLEAVAS
jgi:hypothetical protein